MSKIAGLMFAALLVIGVGTGCTRVEPGYEGIKVNLVGSERGVSDVTLVTGRVFYNPWTTEVYQFPYFVQQYSWTADKAEGSPTDESITFNSIEGIGINADVAIAYSFKREFISQIFQQYRKNAGEITDTVTRMEVRNAFNRFSSQMEVADIYGPGKQALLDNVKAYLNTNLEMFQFDTVSFIGSPRLPENVVASINSVIEAQNAARRAEEQVAQAQAEAQKLIAKAEGEKAQVILQAEATAAQRLLKAEAQAKAVLLEKEAEANGNRMVAESITPALTEYIRVGRWNGAVSRVQLGGNAVPMFNMGNVE